MKTILPAVHTSFETAFLIEDYPFGFRLRCQKKVWVEYRKGKGYRLMEQTSNPKASGLVWNKAKAGTYSGIAMALYLDENGHVKMDEINSWPEKMEAFRNEYQGGIYGEEKLNFFVQQYQEYMAKNKK
jgi:hypothetical protein